MKANKTLFRLIIVALMAFLLFAACEDSEDDDEDEGGSGTDDDDTTTDDDDDDDDDDTTDDDDDDTTDDDDDDVVIDLTWTTEVVDSATNTGEYTSIAMDTSNNVYISYYDVDASSLRYVHNGAKAWTPETVDDSADTGKYSSLGLCSGGFAHISYFDETNSKLKYATNKTGTWVIEDVKPDAGQFSSLAVDSSDWIHVSHLSTDSKTLYYSNNTNAGTWATVVVENLSGDFSATTSTSIALDSNIKVHIAYNTDEDGGSYRNQVRYANNVSKAWTLELVTEKANTEIAHASLDLDANDKAHIAYYFHESGYYYAALNYATNTSGSWENETVNWAEFSGRYNSIKLDDSGYPHVSYFDNYNCAVRYATKQSSTWFTEVVDDENCVGKFTSLAVQDTSHLHISYYDMELDRLKYAFSVPAN